MSSFYGMRILENPNLTESGDPIEVSRTWKERLFTRPWQPWILTKTVIPQVPYHGAIKLNENTLVMHPEMVAILRKSLKK